MYRIDKEKFYPTPRIAQLIKKYSHGECLDAGCGTGEYFPYFNKGVTLYGTDITASYLKKIKPNKKFKKLILKKGDVRKMPFKDNTFDFIVSVAVLEYMKNTKELDMAVKELKRILKKDGVLVVSAPHKNLFTRFIRRYVIGLMLKQDAKDPFFIMGKEYTKQTLEKYNFNVRGCLGWVTWRNLNNPTLAKIADTVFWFFPVLSGSLIGIYEKK